MTRSGKKLKTIALGASVFLMTGSLVVSQILPIFEVHDSPVSASAGEKPLISEVTEPVQVDLSSALDENTVQPLSQALGADREVSVVVTTSETGLAASFDAKSKVLAYDTVADYAASSEGRRILSDIYGENARAKTILEKTGVDFEYGAEYDTLIGGFELVMKAGDFAAVSSALEGTGYSASISEEYEVAEAQLVNNDVNVKNTGIFNSEDSAYDGSGTVIAVLDTGLDYTHSAFSTDEFHPSTEVAIDTAYLAQRISDLRASEYTRGLSAASVYISEKVPYAYDYADKDTNVYPLQSEHGTHVSGVILGKDDTIRGVAPNAQLVSMKVFSDKTTGARWSWILAALEDCITLGVDVINMSLGASCGFSEESEEDEARVYNSVAQHGISLVAAASNDYNSTFGSEKNGNLGLTTNPDSATIGSPGSYTSSLAVASISGVKTPYLMYNGQILYFTESADAASETRNFVDDLLPADVTAREYDYVAIPGVGRLADYSSVDVRGKIAVVRRGDNTFEEKARIAEENGAAGVIIYNNVAGDITMTVGSVEIAVCSMSQDNGELIAKDEEGRFKTGKLLVSREQVAGPFMSNFSSWGPTPDLRIKPEITAHGGDILSAIPGQAYDRLSGTSMASPNQAGVTALVRQYVKENFEGKNNVEVMGLVNQIMMSTADIARNNTGLPYSVRKQGAGLANLDKATSSPAYITTFARNDAAIADGSATSSADTRYTDVIMDKAKIEFGDDKQRDGIYELKFNINNITSGANARALTYDVDAIVMTEGISKTPTHQGDLTVTEEGHLLDGADVSIVSVEGSGARFSGKTVTVDAGAVATVVVRITLSQSDKDYLNQYYDANGTQEAFPVFENGMYVEGYVTLKVPGEEKNALNVPYLAYYGDWTQAPIFDLDYFETDRDARNDAIETLDKTLPDAYATTPIGKFYGDYISYLGSYYFIQEGVGTQISASRDHISLSNQVGDSDTNFGSISQIYGIYAGLLRGAKAVNMTITDTTTGEVIWRRTEENVRKSRNSGSRISPAFIEVDFNLAEYDLKNNTQYLFRAEADLDYPGEQKNSRSVFEFPFVTDFQAPIVTDVTFSVEEGRNNERDRLWANIKIYDNHYAMAYRIGQVYHDYDTEQQRNIAALDVWGRLFTAIPSQFNSTTEVRVELTDYVEKLRNSYNPNSFVVTLYDYAMNSAIYEINIPASVSYTYFKEMDGIGEDGKEYGVTISPNEWYRLEPVVFPSDAWKETLVYTSDHPEVAVVKEGRLFGVSSGTATITARSADNSAPPVELTVKVLSEGEPGYKNYAVSQSVDSFKLTGYYTDFAFYRISNADRDIGLTGYENLFPANETSHSLAMFPSERITLRSELVAFNEGSVMIRYKSNNQRIVQIDDNGTVTALAEGFGSVTAEVVLVDEEGNPASSALFSRSVSIEVKNPYERSGPYLMAYRGGGVGSYTDENGTVHDHAVVIPQDLKFTQIYQYAFSSYQYIPKDLEHGDEITEEDPNYSKIWYYGDNSDVKEVVLPEGVESIGAYAFAGMTSLERIVLPSTLTKIDMGAFYGCTALREIVGLQYVKFINQEAFSGPETTDENGAFTGYDAPQLDRLKPFGSVINPFTNLIAIGDKAFRGAHLPSVEFTENTQSIGAYAFDHSNLFSVTIAAEKIKLGDYAFANCNNLKTISVNASVIPDGVFEGSRQFATVELGKDVTSIGRNAFRGTAVQSFSVAEENGVFKAQGSGAYLLNKDGDTLLYVAPKLADGHFELDGVTTVAANAFSGNLSVNEVTMPAVTRVLDSAFYGCTNLSSVHFAALEEIGSYAFYQCPITSVPHTASDRVTIGNYAFSGSAISEVALGDGATLGEGAFFNITSIASVSIGNNAVIGSGAFQARGLQQAYYYLNSDRTEAFNALNASDSVLTSVSIGDDAQIGSYAFSYLTQLTSLTIGDRAVIGNGAFYASSSLGNLQNNFARSELDVDLSTAKAIGDAAFSGVASYRFKFENGRITGLLGQYGGQTPMLTKVDLSGIEKDGNGAERLGTAAFAYNKSITEIDLGSLTRVPALAFAWSSAPAVDFAGIVAVGDNAFSGSALTEADLGDALTVGSGAFRDNAALTSVILAEGVQIGDSAFEADGLLTNVENLGKADVIGARAFADTAVSGEIEFAASSIGNYAFEDTGLTAVSFTEAITSLGENPFVGCKLEPFSRVVEDEFNKLVMGSHVETTFAVNDSVRVIDGLLYKTLPNGGLGLVTYPLASAARDVVVAEGTRRISAYAFRDASIASAVLPLSLRSIGDRAFFNCSALGAVTFRSVQAPILEEQYDATWGSVPASIFEEGNVHYSSYPGHESPYTMNTGERVLGLDIIKYNMWNIDATNIFYGANFKDRIGIMKPSIVMIRPSNGTNYDSFVFAQYFSTEVIGVAAPLESTLALIEDIKALPEPSEIDFDRDEPVVADVYRRYQLLSSEQQALVQGGYDGTNYFSKLSSCRSTIESLRPGSEPVDPEKPTENGVGSDALVITLSVLTGVFGAAALAAGAALLVVVLGKKKAQTASSEETADGSDDDRTGEDQE